jgi:general secretion pathway protein J
VFGVELFVVGFADLRHFGEHFALQLIPFSDAPDDRGLAMVRERAPFTPMPADAQIRFADQVVLVRAPFRVTFAFAGPDQVWQSNWRDQMQLPNMIRVTVRNGVTGQVLNVSSAAIVHVNAPAECARAKSVTGCLTARLKPDAGKKEEQL